MNDTYTYDAQHTREGWLLNAVDAWRPEFRKLGYDLPERIVVSVGWGLTPPAAFDTLIMGLVGFQAQVRLSGQTLNPAPGATNPPEVFISPMVADPVHVLMTVGHELIHVAGVDGHDPDRFGDVAKRLGYLEPWTSAVPSPALQGWLEVEVEKLGPYPHGGFDLRAFLEEITVGEEEREEVST